MFKLPLDAIWWSPASGNQGHRRTGSMMAGGEKDGMSILMLSSLFSAILSLIWVSKSWDPLIIMFCISHWYSSSLLRNWNRQLRFSAWDLRASGENDHELCPMLLWMRNRTSQWSQIAKQYWWLEHCLKIWIAAHLATVVCGHLEGMVIALQSK